MRGMPKLLAGLALVGIAAVGGARLTGAALDATEQPADTGAGAAAPRAPRVEAVAPTPMTFTDEIRATGTTRSRRGVEIRPETAGRVTEIAFAPGAAVAAGAVLLRLDDASERAELKAAEATVAETRAGMERQARLRDTNAGTEVLFEAAQALALRAEADRDLAAKALADRALRAPFAGVVGLTEVEIGGLVEPSTLVTTLDDLTAVEVAFYVPERYIGRLAAGLPVTLTSAAWPDRAFRGLVTAIDTRVDAATRSIAVRASVDNADRALTGGMFMDVLLGFARREVAAVPEIALVAEGPKSFVYLLENGVARRTEIVTGQSRDGFVEVVDGIGPDARVIVSNLHRLEDGGAVEAEAARAALGATR